MVYNYDIFSSIISCAEKCLRATVDLEVVL